MSLPTFKDLHPSFDAVGYPATNEEHEIHSILLQEHLAPIKRAASICSGGEIPLLTLLPKCGEVVAIDHSYRSLAVTFMKAMLIEKHNAYDMKNFFITRSFQELTDEVLKLFTNYGRLVPEELVPHISDGTQIRLSPYDLTELKAQWFHADPSSIGASKFKLHKLTLLHGDLTDLLPLEKFDVLYLSNALEHNNRNKEGPDPEAITQVVREGGLILVSGNKPHMPPRNWHLLRTIKGIRCHWQYRLFRVIHEPPILSEVIS